MLLKQITQLLVVLSIFSFTAKSQTKPTLTKTMYSYTFTGLESSMDVEKISQEIETLKGVTICKAVLKPETQVGQFVVVVEEYSRTTEGEVMFEITDLKKIIIQNGLVPNELTIEPFSNQ